MARGDVPFHEAAFLGGPGSLRGYPFQRFAGDAAAFGSAELRQPLGQVKLLVRGRLGVFALADAGRVWMDGDSPGDWHTDVGGGLWFETLGLRGQPHHRAGRRHALVPGPRPAVLNWERTENPSS